MGHVSSLVATAGSAWGSCCPQPSQHRATCLPYGRLPLMPVVGSSWSSAQRLCATGWTQCLPHKQGLNNSRASSRTSTYHMPPEAPSASHVLPRAAGVTGSCCPWLPWCTVACPPCRRDCPGSGYPDVSCATSRTLMPAGHSGHLWPSSSALPSGATGRSSMSCVLPTRQDTSRGHWQDWMKAGHSGHLWQPTVSEVMG